LSDVAASLIDGPLSDADTAMLEDLDRAGAAQAPALALAHKPGLRPFLDEAAHLVSEGVEWRR
jgi:hypothetical protein